MDADASSIWNSFDDMLLDLGLELENTFETDPAGLMTEVGTLFHHGLEHVLVNSQNAIDDPLPYSPLAEPPLHIQTFQQSSQFLLTGSDDLQLDCVLHEGILLDGPQDLIVPTSSVSLRTQIQKGAAAERLPTRKRGRTRPSSSSNSNSSRSLRTAARKISRFTESQTCILEDWLSQNLSNPFPDKEAKCSLARSTILSTHQVERWFARTRQRKLPRLETQEPPGDINEEEVFNYHAAHHVTLGQKRSYRSMNLPAKRGFGISRSTIRSSAKSMMDTPLSVDGHVDGRCVLRQSCSSGLDRGAARIKDAPTPRTKSCPPRPSSPCRTEPAEKHNHHSTSYGRSSLEVGHASYPRTIGNTRESDNSGWLDWDDEYPHRADERQAVKLTHQAQDWSIESWLQTLPAKPDEFETVCDIEQNTQSYPRSTAESHQTTETNEDGQLTTSREAQRALPQAPKEGECAPLLELVDSPVCSNDVNSVGQPELIRKSFGFDVGSSIANMRQARITAVRARDRAARLRAVRALERGKALEAIGLHFPSQFGMRRGPVELPHDSDSAELAGQDDDGDASTSASLSNDYGRPGGYSGPHDGYGRGGLYGRRHASSSASSAGSCSSYISLGSRKGRRVAYDYGSEPVFPEPPGIKFVRDNTNAMSKGDVGIPTNQV